MTRKVYGCTRCGQQSTKPEGWLLRGAEVVVSGVTLGTCDYCAVNADPLGSKPCGGKCDGQYRGADYWVCEVADDVRGPWEVRWACWDKACVEGYGKESATGTDFCDCPACPGHEEVYRIVRYAYGKRVEA